MKRLIIALLFIVSPQLFAQTECGCKDSPVCVQVLGSGGPIADDDRAGTSYLIWIDGKAKILVDTGTGSFLRFAATQADFNDIELILLSHMHVDHVNDLPAYIKQGYFTERKNNLLIVGPRGTGEFPGLGEFLESLFNKRTGSFRYLSEFYQDDNSSYSMIPQMVDSHPGKITKVSESRDYEVDAFPVLHGIVPTFAYAIEVRGKLIIFAGDQNGQAKHLSNFVKSADLLVAHMAIPETATGSATLLHAKPSQLAYLAKTAKVRQLVLSHFMARSLKAFDDSLKLIRENYAGTITPAADLMCIRP